MGKRRKLNDDGEFSELKIKPIPIPKESVHPPAPHMQLPNHEFTMGLIAPKGGGKTTTICNLLKFYSGYFHNIIIISPTIDSDEKWDWVRKQKLLTDNRPLKQWLRQMAEKEKSDGVVSNPPPAALEGLVELDDYDGYVPDEHFVQIGEDLDVAVNFIHEIAEEQMNIVHLLKKYGKPKHLANRILVICDDMVGSALFKRTGYFTGLNTRHRHYSMSMIMVSQAYKEIPKTVRTNWTCMLVYEIGNEKEVGVIYEEYSMGLGQKDWWEVYRYATGEEHNFMFINYQKPRHMRIMKNFDEFLFVKKEEDGGFEEVVEEPKKKKKRKVK